jgi:hypothetical protein
MTSSFSSEPATDRVDDRQRDVSRARSANERARGWLKALHAGRRRDTLLLPALTGGEMHLEAGCRQLRES